MERKEALFEFLLRLGDDHLIIGHRLSEWCGHAPTLEEDLSMPNMALDMIGQARALYTYAGEIEGKGRDEDALAYLRTEREYRNLLLVERPNGDFAHTLLRQFYFACFMQLFWEKSLQSADNQIAAVAGKAIKEITYHIRHCGEWIIRLGDGTDESHSRMVAAVDALHPYSDELFHKDKVVEILIEQQIVPDPAKLKSQWERSVTSIFKSANLEVPENYWPITGGRVGDHGEEMGYLIAELQYMQRTYPGMSW